MNNMRMSEQGSLMLYGETMIAEAHQNVSLCFIDICNFTIISSCLSARGLVRFLDELMSMIDALTEKRPGLMKIKTIGDAYFVVAGLSNAVNSFDDVTHVDDLVSLIDFALDVQATIKAQKFKVKRLDDTSLIGLSESSLMSVRLNVENQRRAEVLEQVFDSDGQLKIDIRIGIHYGDVVAGVVGKLRPQYDVWGDACNVAARVESSAVNGTIQISSMAYDVLRFNGRGRDYEFTKRTLSVKGIGHFVTYAVSKRGEEVLLKKSSRKILRVSERRRRSTVRDVGIST
jgi:adenylate cyclase